MTPLISVRQSTDAGSPLDGQTHFLERLRDGVVIVGRDRRIAFFNASYLEQFGLQDGDIRIGDELEAVLHMLAWRGKLGARQGETPDQVVARCLSAWGRAEYPVERRLMDTGRVLDIYRATTVHDEVISVHVDVTDHVRAEQEIERQRQYMKVLLENVSDGINLLDRDGRFVLFNDRFPQLYGIDPAAVAWDIHFRDFAACMADVAHLSPEEREAEFAVRERFARDPIATHARRRLGDGRTLDISKRNLPDGGSVMTIRDITEDLRREEDLLEARNEAEKATRQKSEFVASMSHEMRAPLNGILGVAALLRGTRLDARQRELLDTIADAGAVLLRLMDDVLDLSRLESGPFKAVLEDIELGGLVAECVAIVAPVAAEKNLTMRRRSPPSPLPRLRGDSVRLKQVLLNLLTNAVKFTDQGHVEVAVEGVQVAEGVALAIRVADTGVGIPPEALDRIFESFYQIDGASARRHGGAGLGLAISRGLVQAMGGTIAVSSKPGVGTIFEVRLTLPRADRAAADRRLGG